VISCSDRRTVRARRDDLSESVLQLVAAGDEGAVRACIDRYSGLVWSLARRMLPTEAEAEDAVQEIFVELWRCADRYDPSVAGEATFIAMVTRRRLIDRQRRRGRRPTESTLDEGAAFESAPTRVPNELSDEVGKARKAFEQLSREQQRVLSLSIDRGLSHEQISQSTGLPLGTVKTHARRGLMKLREMLTEHDGQGALS
jgi:RNA polymerase sigma factor (sigma-70 family)